MNGILSDCQVEWFGSPMPRLALMFGAMQTLRRRDRWDLGLDMVGERRWDNASGV